MSSNELTFCLVLYDYEGKYSDELTIREGEQLQIVEDSDPDWIRARTYTDPPLEGLIPKSYVQIIQNQTWDNEDDWSTPPVTSYDDSSLGFSRSYTLFAMSNGNELEAAPQKKNFFTMRQSKRRQPNLNSVDFSQNGSQRESATNTSFYDSAIARRLEQIKANPAQAPPAADQTSNAVPTAAPPNTRSSSPPPALAPAPAPVIAIPIAAPPPAQRFWYDCIKDETQRAEFLANLTKEERTFQQAAYELIVTEQDYVNDLKVMNDVFRKGMLDQKILKPENIDILFANLEEIISVNEKFVEQLDSCRKPDEPFTKGIGNAILNASGSFKCYTNFCCNHPNAVNLIEVKNKKERFAKFLKDARQLPECKGLTLESFLIKPIQRICKYPLLLREMLKNINENHIEYQSLVSAKDSIEAVVLELNEQKRQAEQLEVLNEALAKIKYDEATLNVHGRLVYEGALNELIDGKSAGERYIFLTDTVVLLTKPLALNIGKEKYKLIAQFNLQTICINDVYPTPEAVSETCFELVIPKKYQKISYFFETEDKPRWISEFEKLGTKRNLQSETDKLSQQESQFLQLFLQTGFETTVDPMEQYRREQEEFFRKEKERKQLEEQQQQMEEEAKRKKPTITVLATNSPASRFPNFGFGQSVGTSNPHAGAVKPRPPVPQRSYSYTVSSTTRLTIFDGQQTQLKIPPRPPASKPPVPGSVPLRPISATALGIKSARPVPVAPRVPSSQPVATVSVSNANANANSSSESNAPKAPPIIPGRTYGKRPDNTPPSPSPSSPSPALIPAVSTPPAPASTPTPTPPAASPISSEKSGLPAIGAKPQIRVISTSAPGNAGIPPSAIHTGNAGNTPPPPNTPPNTGTTNPTKKVPPVPPPPRAAVLKSQKPNDEW